MDCYLCKTHSVFLFIKNGYQLFRCPSCSLIQTELKKPYPEFVKEFYSDGYFLGDRAKSAYTDYGRDKAYIQKNMGTFLSRLKACKPKGTLLDVGCAYGYFVELGLKNGFDAYGFDPSVHAVSHVPASMRNRIQQGTISGVSYRRHFFDVMTLFDVFEHLYDPVADLIRLRAFLKNDGIIMIATGDTRSLAARILKRRWTFYIPPQHLFFFNKTTITETLGRAGFEPVAFFRVGKWLSLAYILHLAYTSGESKTALVLQHVIRFLHMGGIPLYIPLGDNMVVIARKTDRGST